MRAPVPSPPGDTTVKNVPATTMVVPRVMLSHIGGCRRAGRPALGARDFADCTGADTSGSLDSSRRIRLRGFRRCFPLGTGNTFSCE